MKKLFNKIIFRIRKFLATNSFEVARLLNEPILKKEIEENPSILSMAPKVLTEEKELKLIKPYLSSLNQALLDKNITNIAITGNYGSGKSTILKTFQQNNPQYTFLNISLASFEIGEDKMSEGLERRLETSILQQIFYHVNQSSIPDSKFRRIVSYGTWKSISLALGVITWIYSILTVFIFYNFEKLNPLNISLDYKIDWKYLFNLTYFLLGLGTLVVHTVRILTNSKINKLSIRGEIEIGEKVTKSVFNEHLEEIFYFFEKTNFNVLIIEDLDRFENTKIFTKLREINILLNNFETIKSSRKINFIYAVRDEILSNKTERVKFFDYIIPIIPFINQSNASEQLTKLIKNSKLEKSLSTEFTKDIISLIDDIDMRLLTNIFTEYKIYSENLKPADLNQDSLFSIVVYKNLFPGDFAKLQRKEGYLYTLISNKRNYTNSLISDLENEIEIEKNEINKINNEIITRETSLRDQYICKILELHPKITEITLDHSVISISELINKNYFEKLVELSVTNYHYYEYHSQAHYYKRNGQFQFKKIEKAVDPEKGYKERLKNVINKENKKIDTIRKKIESINKRIDQIEQLSLAKVFQKTRIDEYISPEINHPLVKNLVINGYIDENYQNFISLFHEESITQRDYKFQISVLSGGTLPFDYSIDKVENLISKISTKYFKRLSILNFTVVDEILTNNLFQEHKSIFLNFLAEEDANSIRFIHAYIKRGLHLDIFFNLISKYWVNFWDNIMSQKYSVEETDLYLKNIVQFADIEDIQKFNLGYDSISHYIEFTPEFLSLVREVNKIKVFSIFKRLNIQIEELQSRSELINDLFEYVLANNHYKLNLYNILSILELKDREPSLYTSINNAKIPELIQYVESNISFFVDKILLREIETIKESSNDFIRLLNHPEISIELKDQLISKQEEKISDLKFINDIEVQKLLLNQVKISSTWNNINTYFSNSDEEMFDDTLVDFLNKKEVYNDLTSQEIDIWLDESDLQKEKISNMIIYSNKLSLDSFKSILPTIPFHYDVLDYSRLSEEKASLMIRSNFIFFSVEGFKILSENYPNERISLVELYPEQFLINIEELEIDDELIIHILESKGIKLENKFQFLSKIDGQKMIENYKIASLASNILAISPFMSLTYQQLDKMFRFNFNWEKKITLLLKHFDFLKHEEVIALAEKLTSNKYYANLFQTRKRPTFEKNDLNRDLFVKLEKKGYIKSFDTNPKNENEFRVIANY
jgi:ABC-type dipeptide/oligopeptide/nickel transport system ATPase subunit